MSMKTILITGGSGYIGSHTVISLLQAGMSVIVLDNLCNSKKEVVDKIEFITKKSIFFIVGDIRDRTLLKTIFKDHSIDAVIHFAGLKAVGESNQKPLEYFEDRKSVVWGKSVG